MAAIVKSEAERSERLEREAAERARVEEERANPELTLSFTLTHTLTSTRPPCEHA